MNAKRTLLATRSLSRWADWDDKDKPALQQVVHGACSQWLIDRGQRLGFSVDPASLMVDGYDQHLEQKERNLRFSTVDLTGVLTVDDPAAIQPALLHGIGSGKAFGCGLMLVRRAS
jgi:CRISPR system Cascade subunit CasE